MPDKKRIHTMPFISGDEKEPAYYANMASVSATPEELIIHFGLRVEGDENRGAGVAKIYLSLPHAKRLAGAMIAAIENYERHFGKIPADPAKRLTTEGRRLLGLAVEEGGLGESNE